jgi:thiol-disulfide isomerase/thioredoxin
MKKIILLFSFALLMGSNAFAQSGIQFTQGTWKEILAQAEKDNKLIFVDAYAEWCGPCKMMARDVFTAQEVGDFFNQQFINAKIDMEKGEGRGLSEAFGIMAYPTLLFVDHSGEIVHRAVGYHTSELLIGLGEAALDPKRSIGSLNSRYDKGDRSPELLRDLASARMEAMDGSYAQIAAEYMGTQQDWNTEENLDFIFRMVSDLGTPLADYLMEYRTAFERAFGEEAVVGKLVDMIERSVADAASEEDLKEVENVYASLLPEQAEQMGLQLKMSFYAQREDWPGFARAAGNYYNKYPAEDWSELNEIAWALYEFVDDEAVLRQAMEWSRQSVAMNKNYYNMDTLASLYYKLGEKKKARKAAQEAIELGKKEEVDYSSTQDLLAKIKKM